MAQRMQELQPEKKQQTRGRRSWVLWTVILGALCAIFTFNGDMPEITRAGR